MKLDRISIFKGFNVIMILLSLLFGVTASIQSKTYMDKNIFFVSPVVNDNKYYFSLKDIQDLEKSDVPSAVSYEGLGSASASFDKIEVYTKIYYTNYQYFTINNIDFAAGGSWTQSMEDENAIVINESLAWALFGNVDAAGERIIISNKSYVITGVAVLGKMAKDNYVAWLPHLTEETDGFISHVYIKMSHYNKLGSVKDAAQMLADMNKESRDYSVTDMNRYMDSFKTRYKLLFFLIGVTAIVYIFKKTWLLAKAFSLHKHKLLPFIVLIVLNLMMAAFIWHSIKFELWLPHFSTNAMERICQTIFNAGLLPPQAYSSGSILMLSKLNTAGNIAFGTGLAGLFNFTFLKGFEK